MNALTDETRLRILQLIATTGQMSSSEIIQESGAQKLATKLPSWMVHDRADMDRFLNAQLEKLPTDHIDYYLVHALDAGSWAKMRDLGVMEFLDRAKADGRIVNAGFSFHGDLPAFREIVDDYGWSFCQIQYNILDERFQAGVDGLEYAAARGLGVIVMEPLRGGMLAGNDGRYIRERCAHPTELGGIDRKGRDVGGCDLAPRQQLDLLQCAAKGQDFGVVETGDDGVAGGFIPR